MGIDPNMIINLLLCGIGIVVWSTLQTIRKEAKERAERQDARIKELEDKVHAEQMKLAIAVETQKQK